MSNAEAWSKARSVLCIRFGGLGDVLVCTPAMRALKESKPGRCITLLSCGSGAEAAPFLPEVDAVVDHEGCIDNSVIARLAARNFDAAVILTSRGQCARPAALACKLAGIPLRLAHGPESADQVFTDWIPDHEPDEVQRQLDLVSSVGCTASNVGLRFALRDRDIESVRIRLRDAGLNPDHQWILLHPSAGAESRRFAAGDWVVVEEQLARRTCLPVVLACDGNAPSLIDEIRAACPGKAGLLAGQFSLGEMAAATKLASLVVSNNTGTIHLTAAVRTPAVGVSAMKSPPPPRWLSDFPNVHHDWLTGVPPERVVDTACSLLARSARLTLKKILWRSGK